MYSRTTAKSHARRIVKVTTKLIDVDERDKRYGSETDDSREIRSVPSLSRDGKRTLDEENLRRALKKRVLDGGGPRLEWKERKDDERQWRWRIRVI
ncbi:hypothetical protein TNCV_5034481 [Trichonephila clavipes]|nr:hypothetical protein TNCV_5034481 [Trichonephila clavipes]